MTPDDRWTVFIDRDGTLVVDQVHNVEVARLTLRPGATEAVRAWRAAGWRIVGVTNNSGIARGKYTEDEMHAFHRAIEERVGTKLDGWYFCPHLPEAGCLCRKPMTGMFERAIADLTIDPRRAFMVGDTAADVGAGAAIGARTIFIPSHPGDTPAASYVAKDLADAARWTITTAGTA